MAKGHWQQKDTESHEESELGLRGLLVWPNPWLFLAFIIFLEAGL